MNECDHLVMFENIDDHETGRKLYAQTVSDLTEGLDAQLDAHKTAELAPDPDEYIFTFCPNCGARIDWDAIRAWAKEYLAAREQDEATQARNREEQHMAELRKLREASFGSVLPP